ncbi:MAG: PhnD/SsuA/transferrin family substrate-binding protein [Pseudomonadota bacterium]
MRFSKTLAGLATAAITAFSLLSAPAAFAAEKITFAVTDVEGLETLQLEFGPFRDKLQELTGLDAEFFPVSNRTMAVEAMRAEQADLGLKYGSDDDPQIVKRNVALEALIRGDIAAVGMNYGHLHKAREAFLDQAFSVVARGRDLPNDILVVRKGVDPKVIEKVKNAFAKHGKELLSAVITSDDNKKYAGGTFLTNIDDADYNYVRSMYETIGIGDFSNFVGD